MAEARPINPKKNAPSGESSAAAADKAIYNIVCFKRLDIFINFKFFIKIRENVFFNINKIKLNLNLKNQN